MFIFAEELIEVPGARENIYKLWINGKCQIDEFWNKIRKAGNYENDLDKIQVIIERISRGELVPPKLFKERKGRSPNDHVKDYEIRVKRLRIYLFKVVKFGKLIVSGAVKDPKSQKADIEKMRQYKTFYINSGNHLRRIK